MPTTVGLTSLTRSAQNRIEKSSQFYCKDFPLQIDFGWKKNFRSTDGEMMKEIVMQNKNGLEGVKASPRLCAECSKHSELAFNVP